MFEPTSRAIGGRKGVVRGGDKGEDKRRTGEGAKHHSAMKVLLLLAALPVLGLFVLN